MSVEIHDGFGESREFLKGVCFVAFELGRFSGYDVLAWVSGVHIFLVLLVKSFLVVFVHPSLARREKCQVKFVCRFAPSNK